MRPYLILTFLVLLVFANSLQNSFVWDDRSLILDNPNINLPLKDMPSLFTAPLWKAAGQTEVRQVYYRPTVSAFFAINYKIWGPNPVGFHLVNIILHTISALILYRIGLFFLNNDMLMSLAAASIFAVHPAATNEPIGRAASGEVIFGFFIILSLYLFLKEKKYLSLFAFSLALFSKETAVMLPFALAVFAMRKNGFKKGILEITPHVFLVGTYLIIRALSVETVLGEKLIEQPLFTRILTMAVATLDYIKLLAIPYPLNPFYPARWHASIFEPKVFIAIIVLISALFTAFKVRRNNTMLFLLSFPFIMLLPVVLLANTFPAGPDLVFIAERYLYVPAMIFPLFIFTSLANIAGHSGKRYVLAGSILVIAVFGTITACSNITWKDDANLFLRIIDASPDASFAHYSLGNVYSQQGRSDDAIKEYLTALNLKSDYEAAHYNLGSIYGKQGRLDEAVKEYLTALKLKPDNVRTHNNLGNVYARQGRADDAVNEYMIALKLKPDDANVHYNLGNVYFQQNRLEEAAREYEISLKASPNHKDARYNLGNIYLKQNRLDDAIREYTIVLKLDSGYLNAHSKLGDIYIRMGLDEEARREFKIAEKLKEQ